MGEVHETTDFVLSNIGDYSDLNASNKKDAGAKFDQKLGLLLNSNAIKFEPINQKIVRCSKDGRDLPIIIKAPDLESGKTLDETLMDYEKHVELLGSEFVEAIIPIRITNPESVVTLKKTFLASAFIPDELKTQLLDQDFIDVFAQDERDLRGGLNIWDYIIKNTDSMDESTKNNLIILLRRLINASDQGYYIDIPFFPDEENAIGKKRNRDNLIVDKEGPTLLDSGTIYKYEPKQMVGCELNALSAQIALDILEKKTIPKESYEIMGRESKRLNNQ